MILAKIIYIIKRIVEIAVDFVLCDLFNMAVSLLGYVLLNCEGFEASNYLLIEVLYWHLPEGLEKTTKHSGKPLSRPRFKLGTSGIPTKNITDTLTSSLSVIHIDCSCRCKTDLKLAAA
jgi:hypothetical protein